MVIGKEVLEMFEGVACTTETDRNILSKIMEKFEGFCISETNETYERFGLIHETKRKTKALNNM